ncbi:hypothetical protein ACFLR7_04630 [Acidobacteriota bacterium]
MNKNNGPKITATENGPYVVSGLESLKTSRGESAKTGRTMVLCRCGKIGKGDHGRLPGQSGAGAG